MNYKIIKSLNFANELLLFMGIITVALGAFYLSTNIYTAPVNTPILGLDTKVGLTINDIQQKNIAISIMTQEEQTEATLTVNHNGDNSLHFDLGNYINNTNQPITQRIDLNISDAYKNNVDIVLLINNEEHILLNQGTVAPFAATYAANSRNEIKLLMIPHQPLYYNYQFKLRFIN